VKARELAEQYRSSPAGRDTVFHGYRTARRFQCTNAHCRKHPLGDSLRARGTSARTMYVSRIQHARFRKIRDANERDAVYSGFRRDADRRRSHRVDGTRVNADLTPINGTRITADFRRDAGHADLTRVDGPQVHRGISTGRGSTRISHRLTGRGSPRILDGTRVTPISQGLTSRGSPRLSTGRGSRGSLTD